MARSVHDDIDAFSSAEDRSRVCGLLCALVEKVDFGRDGERTLETLAVVRQCLSNLDEVKAVLVERYLALAARTAAMAGAGGGALPPKLHAFLRAIFSAAAVTIPAIDDPLLRLRLYTAAATSALRHAALAQADALFRAAIGEIPELPAARAIASAITPLTLGSGSAAALPPALAALQLDLSVASHVSAIASAALAMPGHPELGGSYLARGLLAAVGKYPWSPSPAFSPARPRATMALLPLLQGWLEDPAPYPHIPGVDSNDVLYAGDAEHRAACTAVHRSVCEAVVAQVREAAESGDKGVALDVLGELLEVARLRKIVACDPACAAVMQGALGVLRGLAPAHPAIAAAMAALGK